MFAIGAVVSVSPSSSEIQWPSDYRGFKLTWTGWKASIYRDFLAGQWIAVNSAGQRCFASYPGVESKYFVGQDFNLSQTKEQYDHLVLDSTPPEIRQQYQRETLKRLMKFIDSLPEN